MQSVTDILEAYGTDLPELFDTSWFAHRDASGLRHLQARCGEALVYCEVHLADILEPSGICPECTSSALAAGGSVATMMTDQLAPLLQLLNPSQKASVVREARDLVSFLWSGRNRTINADLHRRMRETLVWPRLKELQPELRHLLAGETNLERRVLVALSSRDIHDARTGIYDRTFSYDTILEATAAWVEHASGNNAVWLLLAPEWKMRLGTVLDSAFDHQTAHARTSMGVFDAFCEDAQRHGGWQPLTEWWPLARALAR